MHPGYGFFSENTDFARAITERGVTFIGPPPEAIEVMGDKISSRIAAEAAGVAGRARHHRVPRPTADEVVAFGEEHGWPVAIKAAYGGGGRGMRVVHSADEAAEALESAQSEALKGFGRDECYVERYLTWPRHIEMQIIADTHGNCVWLGERDCSAQRRHQKLIEESPAPDFPDDIRQAMGEAAVKVAKACGYVQRRHRRVPLPGRRVLLPRDEHPPPGRAPRHRAGHRASTSCAEQLRVAAGEPLSFTQDDIDLPRATPSRSASTPRTPPGASSCPPPAASPSCVPPQGFGVRWDGGYEAGDEVSQYYDNLVGKLIVLGRRPRHGHRPHAAGARASSASRASPPRSPPTSPSSSTPTSPPAEHSTKWVEDVLDLTGVGVRARLPPPTARTPSPRSAATSTSRSTASASR